MQDAERASPWDHARSNPGHPAIIFADTGERRSYGEMMANANRLAHRLLSDGLATGDCVAIFLENRAEYLEAVWAAKQLGVYYVCIPRGVTAGDARYMLANCRASILITSNTLTEVAAPLASSVPTLRVCYMMGTPASGFIAYDQALADQPETMVENRPRGISMLYSSGTTGRPKGVRHAIEDVSPHIAPRRHAYLRQLYDFGPDAVFLNPGPFYHTAPLRMMVHAQREGATTIAYAKFDAETVLRSVQTFGATCGMFVPTMFIRMLGLPEEVKNSVDLATMKVALHGAAPMPPAIKDRMIDWWGHCITEMYGGTEGIGSTIISAAEWKTHRGSVGKPSSVTRLRIEGKDGRECLPGEEGLVVMTQGRPFEYHGDPEKTAEATRADGWGTLGDIGYLDEEGYLYLTDRASNLIITGGVNVYPQEAENVLAGHPDVADVAVFGIPHPEYGEQVHALVVPRPGVTADADLASRLLEFCRAEIGPIKSPRLIEYAPALPRSETGKILKKQLQRAYSGDTKKN